MPKENIEARLQSIESRLSRIESYLHIPLTSTTKKETTQTAASRPKEFSRAGVSPWQEKILTKPGGWLGIVAVICFILAAAFIIKLSIDSGWLTPVRQIALAYLLGVCLIAAGFVLLYKDQIYASLLPGAGIIILYLATFAAHRYYPLMSFHTAISATGIVSAFCIWLYFRIRHDVYAITAALGAYLAPIILEFHETAIFSLYYFILCSLAFATISIWVQSRTLTVISAYLAIIVTGFIGIDLEQPKLIASLLAIQFLIFSAGSFLYTWHTRHPLTETESWSFFPVLLAFYALEYFFIDQFTPEFAPWIALAFAAFLIGLYLIAKTWFANQSLGSQSMVLAFATLVAFHSIYIELLPDDARPWLFVFIIITAAFLPKQYYPQKLFPVFAVPILAIFLIAAIEYGKMIYTLSTEYKLAWLIVSLASFISLWLLLFQKREIISKKDEYGYGLLAAAHLLAITGLYRLTTDISSLAVSSSWLLYAVCVMAFAYARKDKIMAQSALIVLSFAAAKALLYDAASAPTIIRILCLLITGIVLYGAGFLMRKITQWQHR